MYVYKYIIFQSAAVISSIRLPCPDIFFKNLFCFGLFSILVRSSCSPQLYISSSRSLVFLHKTVFAGRVGCIVTNETTMMSVSQVLAIWQLAHYYMRVDRYSYNVGNTHITSTCKILYEITFNMIYINYHTCLKRT